MEFRLNDAGGIRCVGRVFSGVCDFVCLSVCPSLCLSTCPRSKRKKATHTAWQSLGMNSPRGQKVKCQGHAVIECAARVGMQVDMTAWVSSFVGYGG